MSQQAALQTLMALPVALRQHGMAVSPDQTIGFIEAVGVLGPHHIDDVRRAALALFAIPPERRADFDAIFNAIFYGISIAAEAGSSDDEVDAFEATGTEQQIDVHDADEPPGADASATERLSSRDIPATDSEQVLIDFERKAKVRLPVRKSYRWQAAGKGDKLDFARTLKHAARRDGEVVDLSFKNRKQRQRRLLLLIDISGSMQQGSIATLRFAHSLLRAATHAEAFTLGTRLTRITPALRHRDKNIALQQVGSLVADFDGGTRIGEALQAYLSVPRYKGFARGAAVVVVSDGLERGDPQILIDSMRQLSRIAWRITWLSPLAGDADYRVDTDALKAVLPHVHHLGAGHSVDALCNEVLDMARIA